MTLYDAIVGLKRSSEAKLEYALQFWPEAGEDRKRSGFCVDNLSGVSVGKPDPPPDKTQASGGVQGAGGGNWNECSAPGEGSLLLQWGRQFGGAPPPQIGVKVKKQFFRSFINHHAFPKKVAIFFSFLVTFVPIISCRIAIFFLGKVLRNARKEAVLGPGLE